MGSPRVLMIGWEYPPLNSGGLGVACQGLTEALAGDARIYFTLPYQLPHTLSHMQVITCRHPNWSRVTATEPPFLAYSSADDLGGTSLLHILLPGKLTQVIRDSLLADRHRPMSVFPAMDLPRSQLERQAAEYAEAVAENSRQAGPFDVIHAHDWMSLPAAQRVKATTGRPMVAHVHSTEHDRIPHGNGSRYIMDTERQGLVAADVIVAVSHYTKRLLVTKYQLDPAKIQVVHNGVQPPFPTPDPGSHHFAVRRKVVVFMGRMTVQKGPDYFLKLASTLIKKVPTALLVMAGSGDMYQELLLSAAGQGLSTSVLFSGFVRDRQREKLLDRADVFVMPSVSEPFGLVALEAAQRHTPVIVSKSSGVAEVLPSATQLDFWDVDAMVAAITGLLTDQHQARRQTSQQLEHLTSLTWNKAAALVKRIYAKALLGEK